MTASFHPARSVCVLFAASVFGMAAPSEGRAQVVSGSVANAQTTAPVPGAVVALLDSAGTPIGHRTVTDDRGAFSLRAPAAGDYLLEVRAIGFTPLRRRRISLGSGETRAENVNLEPIVTRLANLRVETKSPCRRAGELDPVTTEVWDDVWAALASTEIAREQRLMRADVFLYVRELDVESGLVRVEERRRVPVLDERPFRTAPPEELARYGYWRNTLGGQINLYGADAQTLMSPEFLAAHCFNLMRTDEPSGTRIGLTFRPMERAQRDVEGVLWIDPESRQLRTLEYNYTGLAAVRGVRASGRLNFTRLPNGVWVDDHWLLRQPVEDVTPAGEQRTGRVSAPKRGGPPLAVREGGGFVISDSSRSSRFTTVTGQVRRADRLTEAVLGTTMELVGTELRVLLNEDGTFSVDEVMAGTYEFRVMRSGSSESGGFVRHGTITVTSGPGQRIEFDVPPDSVIAGELCPGNRGRTTIPLFGVIRDARTSRTVPNYQMDIQYARPVGPGGEARVRRRVGGARVKSDWRGEFLVCDVPAGADVRFRDAGAGDDEWSGFIEVGAVLFTIDIQVEMPARGSSN